MRRVRVALASAFAALALVLPAERARAQGAGDGVRLVLHPRAGDTLRTRMEQRTEVTAGPAAAGVAPSGGGMRTMSTAVSIDSRTIVRASYPASTVVHTIVDSARVTSTDPHARALTREAERALVGQQLTLQLATDGTVERAQDARGGSMSREMAAAMSAMPAVFPRAVVRQGDSWTREMALPSAGPFGPRGAARARAVFRLDSLARGFAWVSMQGEIMADSAGPSVQLSGRIEGDMRVDLARRWMTDSRVTIVVKSLHVPPSPAGGAPMRVTTRVTQRLRTVDRR